jgi:lycopene cyclase CruA
MAVNGGRAFDSVCPTVGAVVAKGLSRECGDSDYGDVLYSHGMSHEGVS